MNRKSTKIILFLVIFGTVFSTNSFCRISVESSYQRGMEYFVDGKVKKAEEEFFQGAKNEYSYECLNNLEILNKIKDSKINEQYLLYLVKGQRYLFYRKLQQSLAQFFLALKINPDYPYPYYYLGSVYYKLGELDKSKAYYKLAIKKDSRFASAYFNLGVLYDNIGNSSAAQAYYEESLNLASANTESLLNLGVNLYRKGKYSQAKKCLRKAAAIFHKRGYFNLQSIAERYLRKIPK